MNRLILKLEGLLVLLACIYAFMEYDFKWIWFIVLLFAPDISMVGYLKGVRVGAVAYNLFHTYLLSGIMLVIGVVTKMDVFLMIGIIWTAHIGLDRLLGYGLKYKTEFKDTHLNRL
ncbi:DUF4260 family protein [Paenibacillus nanensis]|uniref:DUF4260 family protein n=1 Tax=Paenibacillus nanensis TaxID=393251 RepID=A0A3A1UMN8_9BACL|nr:DUF4260 domain-containing protein [Paenibacillus nanensis]RIX49358.1 DUF4260 family protein [Paenibacillus nanensis]